ncbi:MAG: FIST C-terminal domain-containing protein [Candidatus Nealsonbacteria bacterium]|nr:FIST C-terminal domain-containing protein [Candidatus Nealsonbacteria bacterium]
MSFVYTGIGVSQKDNLIEAAKEAAEQAKKELGEGKIPKLLMFFCIFTYPIKEYKKAIETVYGVFGDKEVPLVGGSVIGFFAKDKYYFDVKMVGRIVGSMIQGLGKVFKPFKFNGVGVVALSSDYLSIGTGIGLDVDKNPEKAGKDSITQALDNLQYNPSVAYLAMLKKGARDLTKFRPINGFLLTPGFFPKGKANTLFDNQILSGITSITKRNVRLAGGGLCSEFVVDPNHVLISPGSVFFNHEVYQNAVTSIVFGSDLEIGYGTAAGANPLGVSVVITKGEGYVIEELNGKPAVSFLAEIVGKYTDIKKETFLNNPWILAFKGIYMALPEPLGDFYWPVVIAGRDGEKIKTVVPIRNGLALNLIKTAGKSAEEAPSQATKMMIEDAQSENFEFVLFSSCAGRGSVLGKKYFQEIEGIKKVLNNKETPIFGLCSCGEQAFYKLGQVVGTAGIFTLMGISNRLVSETKE